MGFISAMKKPSNRVDKKIYKALFDAFKPQGWECEASIDHWTNMRKIVCDRDSAGSIDRWVRSDLDCHKNFKEIK